MIKSIVSQNFLLFCILRL